MSTYLINCRAVHMPYSYADNYVGEKILKLSRSPHFATRCVLTKIISLVLPIFHALDACRFHFHYLHALMTKKHWIVHPSDSQTGITVDAYAKVRNRHFKEIFTSLFKGLKDPVSAVHFFNKQAELHLPEKAVTFELYPLSRLGDNIGMYNKAKWVSYKLGLPLLLKPFPHWNELRLSQRGNQALPNDLHNVYPTIAMQGPFNPNDVDVHSMSPGIYEIPFTYDARIDWSDETFRRSVQDDLITLNGIEQAELKEDTINVALHYRDGGGFDSKIEKSCVPTKFPKKQYYKEQIDYVLKTYPNSKIHFQVFTDAKNPGKIKSQFESFAKSISENTKSTVTFGCNESNQDPETTTIQDMVKMSQYRCLIRPDSGLSKLAGLIGAPELEIQPVGCHKERQSPFSVASVIDKVSVTKRVKDSKDQVDYSDANIVRIYRGAPGAVESVIKRT